MTLDKLTPEAKFLTLLLGYYIDVANEDKYLFRHSDEALIGPAAATECEINMWMMLEVQTMKRKVWTAWAQDMLELRGKFHTEHFLSEEDSGKLDQLIVFFGTEFNDGEEAKRSAAKG